MKPCGSLPLGIGYTSVIVIELVSDRHIHCVIHCISHAERKSAMKQKAWRSDLLRVQQMNQSRRNVLDVSSLLSIRSVRREFHK